MNGTNAAGDWVALRARLGVVKQFVGGGADIEERANAIADDEDQEHRQSGKTEGDGRLASSHQSPARDCESGEKGRAGGKPATRRGFIEVPFINAVVGPTGASRVGVLPGIFPSLAFVGVAGPRVAGTADESLGGFGEGVADRLSDFELGRLLKANAEVAQLLRESAQSARDDGCGHCSS